MPTLIKLGNVWYKDCELDNGDVPTLVEYGRFPNDAARFCTESIKIKVGKDFLQDWHKDKDKGFGYGMAWKAGSSQRGRYAGTVCDDIYPPHLFMPSKYPQYLEKLG